MLKVQDDSPELTTKLKQAQEQHESNQTDMEKRVKFLEEQIEDINLFGG